jgi:peptidoglycan/xylan/chitin deacetylase (PgdA/CDA1 family)
MIKFRSFLALLAFAILPIGAAAQYSEMTPTPAPVAAPNAHNGPRISYSAANVDGPYIALTFDDGPSKTTTPRLLDLLAKRGVKVTFFVQGVNAHEFPEIIKREVAEGHEIGNHSWDHPNLAKMSESAVRSQLERTQDVIFQITGQKPKVFRPPFGSFSEKQRKWANEQFGFKIILWEVDPLDWKRPGSAVVAQRILTNTKAGYIVLAHDIHAPTVDAMAETVDGLLAKGFKFVTVSELIAMDHPKPKPATPAPSTTGSSSVTPAASAAPTAAAVP